MLWETNMRQAFAAATITRTTGAAIVNQCARAFQQGAGIVRIGKGWNAHLSFKTAQELKAQGILQ